MTAFSSALSDDNPQHASFYNGMCDRSSVPVLLLLLPLLLRRRLPLRLRLLLLLLFLAVACSVVAAASWKALLQQPSATHASPR
jgi:hypothetical protein